MQEAIPEAVLAGNPDFGRIFRRGRSGGVGDQHEGKPSYRTERYRPRVCASQLLDLGGSIWRLYSGLRARIRLGRSLSQTLPSGCLWVA